MKFVVQSLGRFLGRSVCLWLQRSQGSRVFFKKRAHFLGFVVIVGVITTEASQSEKLRQWDGIFYVLWMRGQMLQVVVCSLVCSVR